MTRKKDSPADSFWLFNLYAQGNKADGALAKVRAPFDGVDRFYNGMPPQASFDEVISPYSLESVGNTMMDIEERIGNMSISLQTAALNAGNQELADKIAQRWQEFSKEMEGNNTFKAPEIFVSGARSAMSSYQQVIKDISDMAMGDYSTRRELIQNPELSIDVVRAKAGLFNGTREVNSVLTAVEGDLKAAGLIKEAGLNETSPQNIATLGMRSSF